MKKTILILIAFTLLLFNCKENKVNKPVEVNDSKSTVNPFLGSWSRSFEMGSGMSAKVDYIVSADSIQYVMNGPMVMKYTIKRDTLIANENKWIGTKGNEVYVIFTKNKSNDSITLLKMKVDSKLKAIEMKFPSDTARSKFSSWNTYYKK